MSLDLALIRYESYKQSIFSNQEEQFTLQKQEKEAHVKARFEKPLEYPERFYVPDDKVKWNSSYSDYKPHYYVSNVVLKNDITRNPKGWADPEDLNLLERDHTWESFVRPVRLNDKGIPLNPMGRTGIEGRGLLGKWGANFAADPIITRLNPKTSQLEALLIQRKDCGEWAIPGGMVDRGELVTQTLERELHEETDVQLDFSGAEILYQGYVDDRRNTDNAWMETSVSHLHLSEDIGSSLNPKAGDDAGAVKWATLNQESINHLYASHTGFIKRAIKNLLEVHYNKLSSEQIKELKSLL